MEILMGLIVVVILLSIQYIAVIGMLCDGIYIDKYAFLKDLIPFYFWMRLFLIFYDKASYNLIQLFKE